MWARLLAAVLLASACTETPIQPTDAGPFVVYEGGHPAPTMFGSPCELGVNPPERCCGEVAKEIPGGQCYGCSGKVAYALCIGGAFTCACTCESPAGYTLLGPDGGGADCGSSETDAAVDAFNEGASDATADVDSAAIVDAHDGG